MPITKSMTTYRAIIALLLATSVWAIHPTVTIDSGTYVGLATDYPLLTGHGRAPVNKFLGIPFAVSPPKRFQPPEKLMRTGSFQATAQPSACIQLIAPGGLLPSRDNGKAPNPLGPENEDCLNLDVYAPATPAPPGGRTVLAWVYGGGFNIGWIGMPIHDGTSFAARQDVVLVAANYRTNVFGFPNATGTPVNERNLGFLDQRMALDWIQRNIAQFGGDPRKVTIFGQSAGGASVDELILTLGNQSNPPFRAAIAMSGASYLISGSVVLNKLLSTSLISDWDKLATNLSCPIGAASLACLSNKTVTQIKDTILANNPPLSFGPVWDGDVTVVANEGAVRSRGIQIPLMMGSAAREGLSFNATLSSFRDMAKGNPLLAPLLESLLAPYNYGPGQRYPDEFTASVAFFTDGDFNCPVAKEVLAAANHSAPVYRYLYNATFPNTCWTDPCGPAHGTDVPIVFGTYNTSGSTENEIKVSHQFQTAWANFAKYPYGRGPGWTRVANGKGNELAVFGSDSVRGPTMQPFNVVDGQCDTFNLFYSLIPTLLGSGQAKTARLRQSAKFRFHNEDWRTQLIRMD